MMLASFCHKSKKKSNISLWVGYALFYQIIELAKRLFAYVHTIIPNAVPHSRKRNHYIFQKCAICIFPCSHTISVQYLPSYEAM